MAAANNSAVIQIFPNADQTAVDIVFALCFDPTPLGSLSGLKFMFSSATGEGKILQSCPCTTAGSVDGPTTSAVLEDHDIAILVPLSTLGAVQGQSPYVTAYIQFSNAPLIMAIVFGTTPTTIQGGVSVAFDNPNAISCTFSVQECAANSVLIPQANATLACSACPSGMLPTSGLCSGGGGFGLGKNATHMLEMIGLAILGICAAALVLGYLKRKRALAAAERRHASSRERNDRHDRYDRPDRNERYD